MGATLVAITPQPPEHSLTMVERHDLGFDLLSDPGSEYAASLGLRFEVPEALREVYLKLGVNLPEHNREDSWTLPMPGRLVVGSDGVVVAVDVDPDYTHRPEPEETLAHLRAAG